MELDLRPFLCSLFYSKPVLHEKNTLLESLHHVNAFLNLVATILLVTGFVLIKRKRETLHKITMLATFGVSVLFLCSYLTRIISAGEIRKFPAEHYSAFFANSYYLLLVSHVILATLVPFLAVTTIWWGLTGQREKHRWLARWTFPIWLYVSITGVLVYLMLYWWFPPPAENAWLSGELLDLSGMLR